ncbi:MAG: helix-turn-helix domain-containing protein [Sedimentitalea sp.]|uniref:Crp/Fnr family transcriptional regulator n=1 Tax=Sedimentitalea sp. TaxID=2048915 RepID=UPI003263B730
MNRVNQEGTLCQNLAWQNWTEILELGRHVNTTSNAWLEAYSQQDEQTAVFLSGRVGLRPISDDVDDGHDIIAKAAPAIINLSETYTSSEAHWIIEASSIYLFTPLRLMSAFSISAQFAANFMQILQCQTAEVMCSPIHSDCGSKRLAASLLARLEDGQPAGQKVFVTQAQLATETGLSRQWVNRLLKQFERQGIAELGRGHVLLRAPARLECQFG